MRKVKVTSVSQMKHGVSVQCKINGEFIDDAKISVGDPHIYICQNIKCGDTADDKLGYSCSWSTVYSTRGVKYDDELIDQLSRIGVRDLVILEGVSDLTLKSPNKLKV